MPSTYSHYRFGKEVLKALPESVQTLVAKHRSLYDMGLHGADICLYYEPMTFNAVKKTCFAVHKEYGDELFARISPRIASSATPMWRRSIPSSRWATRNWKRTWTGTG